MAFVSGGNSSYGHKVLYGGSAPTVSGFEKQGDVYLVTPTGDNTTQPTQAWVFDGSQWMLTSPEEILKQAGPLSGSAGTYKWGIDLLTGKIYYPNVSNLWTLINAGKTDMIAQVTPTVSTATVSTTQDATRISNGTIPSASATYEGVILEVIGATNITPISGPLSGIGTLNTGDFIICENTNGTFAWKKFDSTAPLAADFFRTVTGALLPDGTTDTTEDIRRDGFIGLNVNPLSNLDVNGSLGLSQATINAAAYTATIDDYVINLALTGAQTLTLPAVSTGTRRIYRIVNPTAIVKTISSYIGSDGIATTIIPANSWMDVQSNGTVWNWLGGATAFSKDDIWRTAGNTNTAAKILGSTDNTAVKLQSGTATLTINEATAGNVGIGTATPTTKLEVNGEIKGTRLIANGAGAIVSNTAVGGSSLIANTTGTNNTAIGFQALLGATTGSNNVAIGGNALQAITTGNNNVGIGSQALRTNTTGSSNIAIGAFALVTAKANSNVAIGHNSQVAATTSLQNVSVGANTLFNNTTGANNTVIGHNSGLGIVTGGANTIIGANVTGLASGLSNNIILADGGGNQRINVDGAGNVGINTIAPTAKLHVNGTFTTQAPTAAANQVANFTISTAQVNVASVIVFNQTTAGILLTAIGSPTSTTTGRFLRIHNIGTASFSYLGDDINPSTFLDLQWNGTAWAKETKSGKTVDYVNAKLTADATGLGVNATIPFNTIVSNSVLTGASGVFTLTAGKTYDMQAALRTFRGSFGDYDATWQWVDNATGNALAGQQSGHGYSSPSSTLATSQPIAKIIYTPSTNQTVRVKLSNVNAIGGLIDISADDSWLSIVQLGRQ